MASPAPGVRPSVAANEARLCAWLVRRPLETMRDAAGVVSPIDFEDQELRRLWSAAVSQWAQDKPIEVPVLVALLGDDEEASSLVDELLAVDLRFAESALYYAKKVADSSRLREIASAAQAAINETQTPEQHPDSIIAFVAERMESIASRGVPQIAGVEGVAESSLREFEERKKTGGKIIGLETGLVALDCLLQGIKPCKYYIIASRPSVGKTSLALNIVRNIMLRTDNGRVLFYSLETDREEIVHKLIACSAKVCYSDMVRGAISDSDWPALVRAGMEVDGYGSRLLVDDCGRLTPDRMKADVRRESLRGGIAAVFVDYLQLMSGTGRHENRQLEVASISRSMKLLALSEKIPVIALSQMSRAVESRTDKTPVLSDLRDSGGLEQDADGVIFLSRDITAEDPEEKSRMTISVAKHRGGPTGMIKNAIRFNYEWGKFLNTIDPGR